MERHFQFQVIASQTDESLRIQVTSGVDILFECNYSVTNYLMDLFTLKEKILDAFSDSLTVKIEKQIIKERR